MKKLFTLFALAALPLAAEANGPGGPFTQTNSGHFGGAASRLPFFRQTPVPAFQAAPWYLYWPYNAHFQMAAPMGGGFTPPPGTGMGGGMVNPYFANPYYGGAAPTPVMPSYSAPGSATVPSAMPSTAMPAVLPMK